jgi:hypothetical protein
MATIDSNIALGVKPVQVENPINQYAAMSQIQSGQQANQLNALKLQEMQRGMGEEEGARNYLTTANLSTPEGRAGLAKFGKTGLGYGKLLADQDKANLERTKLANEIDLQDAEKKRENIKNLIFNPSNENIIAHIQDRVKDNKITPEEAQQQWQTVAGMDEKQRKEYFTMQGTKADEYFKQIAANNAPTPEMKNYQAGLKDPGFVSYQMNKAKAGASQVILPAQEKAFESELGTGQAKGILKSKEGAMDAASILQTNEVGRKILNSGAITGAGADFFVGLNQALKTAGIDAGYADASANSQAYAAAMGQNTAKLIKQFGAGTGLSDNDRVYAEKIAAGKVSMDETAIRKILDINDRAARNVIKAHNKNVEGIKTNIPLKVELPRGEPVRTGTVKSGPNAGKRAFEYADGTVEYQ